MKRRILRTLSGAKQRELRKVRQQVRDELPELVKKLQVVKNASKENTFSGELRRAIHSSKLLLPTIADRANIPLLTLDYFLTGEKPLPSDMIDRLVEVLGYRLRRAGKRRDISVLMEP